MKNKNFDADLPAIWLVFGGSYLNHSNAPHAIINEGKGEAQTTLGHREQLLVNLLCSYLKEELVSPSLKQPFDEFTRSQLANVCRLLELWSEDLSLIYQVREQKVGTESKVRQIVKRFYKRINAFTDCTCIPTGLISAEQTEGHENVSLAILKRKGGYIDWIQVNPGSAYHQSCQNLIGERSNAYLKISGIDCIDITEEWLQLLLSLKTSKPCEGFYYKELSMYECLLSHLNGKTVFQPQPDEGFVEYSHSSPAHMWQVIELSFCYFLSHFLDDSYQMVYRWLQTGFKLFLMEKTLDAYHSRRTEQIQQCQFLLQEMCRNTAQQALDHGNAEQKTWSFCLISSVKTAIERFCGQQEQQLCLESQLGGVRVSSLRFVPPNLINYNFSSSGLTLSNLEADPVFVKPNIGCNIIEYLIFFKNSFINKLVHAKGMYETVLLSHGIEVFFIDYLFQTGILQKCQFAQFSQDDLSLACILVELGEIYYGCQGRLAQHFLSAENYQPLFYAKNVIIQFFLFAAVAALNFRHPCIGPLLASYNLSTACSKSLNLAKIIPHLVIEDSRWLEVLFAVQDFFVPDTRKGMLFSCTRFQASRLQFRIENKAETKDMDVMFAYLLLQNNQSAFIQFFNDNIQLEEEMFNKKWVALTYRSCARYLPTLYDLLSRVAYCAKAALTGFPSVMNSNRITTDWVVRRRPHWHSIVDFQINGASVMTNPELSQLASYKVKSEASYQRFISCKDKGNSDNFRIHFLENEIIASQDEKPETMDCNRYMQLGFLQSEPQLKLQRLYIALKEQQLDFSREEEGVLIKQTLFEVSLLMNMKWRSCTLLEWTVHHNPELIHKLGLLIMEKAQAMRHRLTQHHRMGDILLVALGLLTFYPSKYKDVFIEGFVNIYYLLKEILTQSPAHLKDQTLLHLNAYLIISIRAKPQLLETETLTVLKALLAIQTYKVKGIHLENSWLLHVHEATFAWCSWIEDQLQQRPNVLNRLLSSVVNEWDEKSLWQRSSAGFLYTCNDYAIKPLHGSIYYKNCSVIGLPSNIMEHEVFKEYFGTTNFAVLPSSYQMNSLEVPCYLSVDLLPQVRLTFCHDSLLIEEKFGEDYHRYIPAQELACDQKYPKSLLELSCNGGILRHWLDRNAVILIKDQHRKVIFEWDLANGFVLSKEYNGYIVPWYQLQASFLKSHLEQVESPEWIHFIVQLSPQPRLMSLNFPRLGLHFDYNYKYGKFSSMQINGYFIAGIQHLNTLHGFSSYLVLEKEGPYSVFSSTKVIIPHRKVKPKGPFYVDNVTADCNEIRSPAYFVYDFDTKLGLLKGHHIRAQLYLALLYFHSATLDDHDVSHCNAYHLARENLELCWKDQPYDEIELGIIKQFLSVEAMRDFHSHRVALYLKVLSLLISSLRLRFLYISEAAQLSKEKSDELLREQAEQLPHLLFIYLQNKSTISARIRLSHDEEGDIINQCILANNDGGKHATKKNLPSFEAYYQLYFKKQPQVVLTMDSKKPMNFLYEKLFSNILLSNTAFLDLFMKQLSHFSFAYDSEGINFSDDIRGILLDQFRLPHFIMLYNMARTSCVPLKTFCYLLHHMMLKAMVQQESFPLEVRFMLARALLLVAENPSVFPESPGWFNKKCMSLSLSGRCITSPNLYNAFPSFHWSPQIGLSREENESIKAKEWEEYNSENKQIWSNFNHLDLDPHGIPRSLPDNPDCFALQYESCIKFKDYQKRDTVRVLYLQAAYNDAMYRFFTHVLSTCDTLKFQSTMGWSIASFIPDSITETIIKVKEELVSPVLKPISLERWAVSQEPLIDLNHFFAVDSQPPEINDFLFESQLKEPKNGYQHHFYNELKESWSAYHEDTKCTFSWRSSQSVNELEYVLQTKYNEISKQAKHIWNHISAQFKQRYNKKSNDYFALRWYSGQVHHYHKGDLLTLLIKPHKLAGYNPDCFQIGNSIIHELLQYVTHEINCSKVMRVLALLEKYTRAEDDLEKFSLLQGLVRCLLETIDPMSYCHPHWFLFQLENEIIVRDNQRELIVAMLNQESKAMYQLNMGEGKSSVILPLLSHNLANGKQLLRINVLSALLITMQDFLRQQFSGFIRKRVYTLPFTRNTDISTKHLTLILVMLKVCLKDQHILLVTPEHRLCLQLKTRELLLESQQQIGATNIFNWETYRQRAVCKVEVYQDLTYIELKERLKKQDQRLRTCLIDEAYIDSNDRILKVPPRGQDRTGFTRFKEIVNDPTFREWSCLKAAYRELLYNSTLAQKDCFERLALLSKINGLAAIDLLDESDEILKHGTELNYTIGDKRVFAGGELRWQIPQFFIRAIFCDPDLNNIISAGKSHGFTAGNLSDNPQGRVPFLQLLNESYYETSIKPKLIDKFLQENLPTFRKYNISPYQHLVEGEDSSLRLYIAGKLLLETEKKLLAFLSDKGPLKDKLLIAKGWLSHGILFHVFNAKYRVDFGLNMKAHGQTPKQIAIPFLGKDTPSPRSEFSHPDVMLGFTIISYLYQGLSQKQLKETLVKLKGKFSHKVADAHLNDWTEAGKDWIMTQTDQFPPLVLTSLQHIDLADEQCIAEVHNYLSGNYLGIFFYLNQFVLIEEAMQYCYKISANAHSLVGYQPALGFSGTDDRKITMPFQIQSLCSTSQKGTNGKLLSVLTQKRNSSYHSLPTEDTMGLLKHLCQYVKKQHHCHALIDAGALVTGLMNYDVAELLLFHLPDTFLGVLYFSDEGNRLTVLTRDGKTTALQDCYLDKKNLFAYLDDIHTRGTDIQLPLNCHAILTIGMGMFKDKLMQASMRLRQLAQKQSVSLWGSQAVTLAIARDNSIDVAKINSLEVIKWVTRNTINHINKDLFPVALRKINFQFLLKAEAWLKEAPATLNTLIQYCQQKELFLLEEFYALSPQCEDLADRLDFVMARCRKKFWQELESELQSKNLTHTAFYQKVSDQADRNSFKKQLSAICEEVLDFLQRGYMHQSLEDDEEREVEVEIVQEQQVSLKVENRPAYEEASWNVKLLFEENFIEIAEQLGIIMPLSAIKQFIQVPANLKNVIWHSDIYMTENFVRSVKSRQTDTLDNYLRPVDVVLMHCSMGKSRAVLLSGHEASHIKFVCCGYLHENRLIHINDVNGPTQLPVNSTVSKEEQKLLTIIKLFSGECHFVSSKEVLRLAKRVGRIHPHYFRCVGIDANISEKIFASLIQEGYLDFAGVMTEKLFEALRFVKLGDPPLPDLAEEYLPKSEDLMKKLHGIFKKLIFQSSCSLQDNHYILWQWIGTRRRLREYPGSVLESIINSEYQIKLPQ